MTTEQRLEALERQLARTKRRSRWLMGVAGLAATTWIVGSLILHTGTAEAQPRVVREVRANRFSLVDETGKLRAVLAVLNTGPVLALADENGKGRIALGVDSLCLYDETGKGRAELRISSSGSNLVLADEAQRLRVLLAMAETGPSLNLFDANGRSIWSAP